MEMGINACKYLHELQKDALRRAYGKKASEEDDEAEDDEYDDDLETDLGEADIMEDE
jgi:hypothetical protein